MIYAGLLIIWAWVFFLLYVGAMGIMGAYNAGKLNWFLIALCVPYMLIALAYDFISNVFIFSVIYFELPHEKTVTTRLKRHIKQDTWRGQLSRFICQKILSPFDPTGDHCD